MDTSHEPPLEQVFLKLVAARYEITSPATRQYNCVAWAAGHDDVAWDHRSHPFTWWPRRVSRDGSVDSLIAVFESLGFVRCDDGSLEPGLEKVAIYGRADNDWTHAARQLPDGRWTSKLGGREDVRHDSPHDVECDDYGSVACYLKRPAK